LFKSFYEKVRLRIACRNHRYIPKEKLFELSKKLYMVSIVVEGQEQDEKKKPDRNDDDGQGDNEDDLSDDDYDDLDDLQEQMDMDNNAGKDNKLKTPSTKQLAGSGSKTVAMEAKQHNDPQSPMKIAQMYSCDRQTSGDEEMDDKGLNGEVVRSIIVEEERQVDGAHFVISDLVSGGKQKWEDSGVGNQSHVKLPICDGLNVEIEEEAKQKRLSGMNEQKEDERDSE
jgi:hypothetical protein